MNGSEIGLAAGDYLTPDFTRASVMDAMRHGVITCPPDMPLRAVARMMATHHVHSVVITGREPDRSGHLAERPWGVVSDLDLVRSADRVDDLMAGEIAPVDVPTVRADTPLAEAARAMAEQGVTHLVVVTAMTGQPIGVISSLDIAGNLAWARG
jgi:CBS domain-containing protein